jgi:hypothetical protein
MTEREKEWGAKASRFLKAGIGYKELAERLNNHGMEEPKRRSPASSRAGHLRRHFSSHA